MKSRILSIVFLLSILSAGAVEFPGPNPGDSNAIVDEGKKEYTLCNDVVSVTWKVVDGEMVLHNISNKLSGKSHPQKASPVFKVTLAQSKSAIQSWIIKDHPEVIEVKAIPSSSSNGKHFGGKAITFVAENPESGISIRWTGELRDGANYAKSTIKLSSSKAATISRIDMLSNYSGPSMRKVGTHKAGSPLVSGQMFFGIELPFFKAYLGDSIGAGFECKVPVDERSSPSFSSVIGVYPKDHLRRAFLHYIERERVRSYKQFLHYNCWFDLPSRALSADLMLGRINMIHQELGEKRGVKLDSYVVDDGYDDPKKGFWVFNEKFPDGFTPLAKRLAEIDSHLGVWLSPAGGYGGALKGRRARAQEEGYQFDLTQKKYYDWFLARHKAQVTQEQINYFKWDRLGGGATGHFMALMDIGHQLRKINPDLFINTTVGTWQSPFWLNHVDCTWRGGHDMGFQGDGCKREQWITYRDGISYGVISKSEFIYPLNALMNHGIVYANGHKFANSALKGSHDLRNEVRSYFAGGYALQELYLSPDILKKDHWDVIAESAKWAQRQTDCLVDSHFIGGDPLKLDVYGFAGWNNNKGSVTLRNPSKDPQKFEFDIQSIFELPAGAAKSYKLASPYKDQRIQTLEAEADKLVSIELKPFEVLVFDAN